MEYKKDKDGNDLLDENGNKIPVEITDEEKESDAKLTAALAPVVEELKELRLANGMLKDMLNSKEEVPPTKKEPVTEEEKLAAAIKIALDAEKSSNAQTAKKTAFEKFITENKEFHPDNDTLGIKRDALQKKFAQFNTEGLTTVEEFIAVIGDAKRLLVGNDTQQATPNGKQAIIPQAPIPRNSIKPAVDQELSPKEQKLAETTGRTKEQILKMKQKHPEMLEGLLEFVRD